MIALDVYFTAKAGESAALEKAIVDVWMEAMRRQPGFLQAAMNTPFPDEELEALAAAKPAYTHGVVSFWESEERRLDWVAPLLLISTRRYGNYPVQAGQEKLEGINDIVTVFAHGRDIGTGWQKVCRYGYLSVGP